MTDLLLRACCREAVERPPVWMMRQAGRYLPEYRKVRERADFLTMCRTPAIAAEVTLQPVDILGVDAAIIFSDILVIPQAMGLELTVEEGVGPRFPQPLRTPADLARLRDVLPEEGLGYVLDAIGLVTRELAGRVPVVGFAGAPWTLLAYMIEGGGSKHFTTAKRFLLDEPAASHALLGRLAEAAGSFLQAQVRAGARMVQLFDSSVSALGPADFRTFALPYLARATKIAKQAGVPVVAFAPGAGWAIQEIVRETGCDVLGIDWQTDPAESRKRLASFEVALQGNFEPHWLYHRPEVIRERTREMLRAFGPRGHIANLGHGIFPDVPVENARAFVDAVKEWRW